MRLNSTTAVSSSFATSVYWDYLRPFNCMAAEASHISSGGKTLRKKIFFLTLEIFSQAFASVPS
jgi:hypothetical protein